jgi:uncharacterized C2H2 Zn-finger protein
MNIERFDFKITKFRQFNSSILYNKSYINGVNRGHGHPKHFFTRINTTLKVNV